jgi:hypothetical protein
MLYADPRRDPDPRRDRPEKGQTGSSLAPTREGTDGKFTCPSYARGKVAQLLNCTIFRQD